LFFGFQLFGCHARYARSPPSDRTVKLDQLNRRKTYRGNKSFPCLSICHPSGKIVIELCWWYFFHMWFLLEFWLILLK
jgi:hypothetical protein